MSEGRMAERPSAEDERGLRHLLDGTAAVVQANENILRAVQVMREMDSGAVAVVQEGRLQGILTEGDVVARVVLARRNPEKTVVKEVMTRDVQSLSINSARKDAIKALIRNEFRHVPVCDENGSVVGLRSGASLFRSEVGRLGGELDSLESFLTADGLGG
jgi:signal-transduction protein with cAMP-binding, CBS, and nucleotidyltransferase domain